MCVAYPGLVLEIADSTALVEIEGRRRRASLILVPEVAVGDWVVVSAGTVLHIVDPDEAQAIRTLLDAAIGDQPAPRDVTAPMRDQPATIQPVEDR